MSSNMDRSAQRISTMLSSSRKSGAKSAAKDEEEYVPEPLPASADAREPRFNPFEEQEGGQVLDLSLPNGPATNFKPVEIRFHSTKTVGTGSIRIDSKKNNSVSSFDGIYIRSYAEGEDPEFRVDSKTNKKVQRFALTAKHSILPELHRAAGILILTSRIFPEISMRQVLGMEVDENGYLNICDPQAPHYSKRICQ